MLLAIKDKEGTMMPMVMWQFAIGGAVLAELFLLKKIEFVKKRWGKFVSVCDSSKVGDDLLDEAFDMIKNAKRSARVEGWLEKFGYIKQLKKRIAIQLCNKNILTEEEEKVLFLFTRKIYPEVNPLPEKEIIDRLRKAVLSNETDIDPRTIVLLALTKSANLLNVVFEKKEIKANKKRIEKLVKGEISAIATQEVIEALSAAILVAVIMPMFVSASTS